MNKSRPQRRDPKAERYGGQKPPWSDPFTGETRRDLKDDIADVEDGQDRVIAVPGQAQILLEAGEAGISYDTLSENPQKFSHMKDGIADRSAYRYLRGR